MTAGLSDVTIVAPCLPQSSSSALKRSNLTLETGAQNSFNTIHSLELGENIIERYYAAKNFSSQPPSSNALETSSHPSTVELGPRLLSPYIVVSILPVRPSKYNLLEHRSACRRRTTKSTDIHSSSGSLYFTVIRRFGSSSHWMVLLRSRLRRCPAYVSSSHTLPPSA